SSSVLAGGWYVGALAEPRAAEELRAERRRIGRAHRVHALDLRRALEQRDAARIERGGEAVEGGRVTELGLTDEALQRQGRNEQLLRGERGVRPAAFVLARHQPAGVADTIGERGCLQQDDDALADRDPRAL